jgi:hypothetical protein
MDLKLANQSQSDHNNRIITLSVIILRAVTIPKIIMNVNIKYYSKLPGLTRLKTIY